MKQTVLANDGAVGLSIAGETNQFKIIANIMMMADRLAGDEPGRLPDDVVVEALEIRGLKPDQENIAKVMAFYKGAADDSTLGGG